MKKCFGGFSYSLKVPYHEKQVFSGLYIKLALPEYKAGFALTLTLIKGSVPTIPDPTTALESQPGKCHHILIVFTVTHEYGEGSWKLAN